jgi:hypothetical protein
LESEAAVLAAIDYIHLNPVRRGLCERAIDWRWSSARYYADPTAPPDACLMPLCQNCIPCRPNSSDDGYRTRHAKSHCWTSQQ